jgi:hypothetical protein
MCNMMIAMGVAGVGNILLYSIVCYFGQPATGPLQQYFAVKPLHSLKSSSESDSETARLAEKNAETPQPCMQSESGAWLRTPQPLCKRLLLAIAAITT